MSELSPKCGPRLDVFGCVSDISESWQCKLDEKGHIRIDVCVGFFVLEFSFLYCRVHSVAGAVF